MEYFPDDLWPDKEEARVENGGLDIQYILLLGEGGVLCDVRVAVPPPRTLEMAGRSTAADLSLIGGIHPEITRKWG